MNKVNLVEKFSLFNTQWDPKIVGELNGQHIKLAKLEGDFVWHTHENEDEFFMVIKGHLTIKQRDAKADLETVELDEGEFYIVPKGVEHLPIAIEEAHVMMFEPIETVNTGNLDSDKTVTELEKL
jgi:mannose-6-phosphate isomerase-like protein (cupin superfamily)